MRGETSFNKHNTNNIQIKPLQLVFGIRLKIHNDNSWLLISYVYFASSSWPLCVAKLSALFKHFLEAGRLLSFNSCEHRPRDAIRLTWSNQSLQILHTAACWSDKMTTAATHMKLILIHLTTATKGNAVSMLIIRKKVISPDPRVTEVSSLSCHCAKAGWHPGQVKPVYHRV